MVELVPRDIPVPETVGGAAYGQGHALAVALQFVDRSAVLEGKQEGVLPAAAQKLQDHADGEGKHDAQPKNQSGKAGELRSQKRPGGQEGDPPDRTGQRDRAFA